jgi:hypothetical protein
MMTLRRLFYNPDASPRRWRRAGRLVPDFVAVVFVTLDFLSREIPQVGELGLRVSSEIARAMLEQHEKTKRRDEEQPEPKELRYQTHFAG